MATTWWVVPPTAKNLLMSSVNWKGHRTIDRQRVCLEKHWVFPKLCWMECWIWIATMAVRLLCIPCSIIDRSSCRDWNDGWIQKKKTNETRQKSHRRVTCARSSTFMLLNWYGMWTFMFYSFENVSRGVHNVQDGTIYSYAQGACYMFDVHLLQAIDMYTSWKQVYNIYNRCMCVAQVYTVCTYMSGIVHTHPVHPVPCIMLWKDVVCVKVRGVCVYHTYIDINCTHDIHTLILQH